LKDQLKHLNLKLLSQLRFLVILNVNLV
jgi:hypothetical protein